MTTFLDPSYLVTTYYLIMTYYVILLGMALIDTTGEYAQFGWACLFLGVGAWAGVTGIIHRT